MNRLPPLPMPPARGAGKARFLAASGLMVALVALAARRFDLIDTVTLLASLALAVAAALFALAFVAVTLADIWREGRKSPLSLATTVFLVILTLAPPTAAGLTGVHLPAIAMVSTDADTPPALPERDDGPALPFDLLAPPDQRTDLAATAYPDVAPQYVDVSVVEAYALARLTAGELGWAITGQFEPASESATGRLVASGHSLIVGLPFDVVVRIAPGEDGTRIDLTSGSRDALPDLGENARNIRAFIAKFREVERRPSAG